MNRVLQQYRVDRRTQTTTYTHSVEIDGQLLKADLTVNGMHSAQYPDSVFLVDADLRRQVMRELERQLYGNNQ